MLRTLLPSVHPPVSLPSHSATPRRLNLGCGDDIRAGFVNVDAVARPGVGVVHDLDDVPWPIEDDTFDYALCSHVLEHVRDFHRCLLELQRVCRAGAEIEVIGPYFFSTKFAGDPSHRIPFSYRTFDNYTPPRRVRFYNRWRLKYATNFGAGFLFETIDKRYIFDRSPAIAWIGWLHNLAPLLYERFCPAFLPPMEVYFRLRVVRPTAAGRPGSNTFNVGHPDAEYVQVCDSLPRSASDTALKAQAALFLAAPTDLPSR